MNSLPPPIPPSNDGSNFAGPPRYDPLAIASLVCFIVSFRVGGLTALPAFVLAILSLRRIKAEPERLKGRGMALAGMILGALSIGLFVLIWLVFSSSSCSVCVL